jgi:hypothetical protein
VALRREQERGIGSDLEGVPLQIVKRFIHVSSGVICSAQSALIIRADN